MKGVEPKVRVTSNGLLPEFFQREGYALVGGMFPRYVERSCDAFSNPPKPLEGQ